MIRRLIIVNFALLALLGFLIWELGQKMKQAKARENAILLLHVPPANVAKPPALKKVPALDASAFQDAITKYLFSQDRNPIPIPDPPPPPPAPPPVPAFPVARGVMLWEGVPPTVVLSPSKGSADQRGYHPGDKIGEWTIASVDQQFLVLEWHNQLFKKRLDELMDRTPITVAESAPAAKPAEAAKRAVTSLSDSKNGQGPDMGGGVKACAPGDTQPAGTVVDGRKKVVSETPFGSVCRWEPVQ